jgi:hypothetical protein
MFFKNDLQNTIILYVNYLDLDNLETFKWLLNTVAKCSSTQNMRFKIKGGTEALFF